MSFTIQTSSFDTLGMSIAQKRQLSPERYPARRTKKMEVEAVAAMETPSPSTRSSGSLKCSRRRSRSSSAGISAGSSKGTSVEEDMEPCCVNQTTPPTPPESTYGSPRMNKEAKQYANDLQSQPETSLPLRPAPSRSDCQATLTTSPVFPLPSLKEFDQGVAKIARGEQLPFNESLYSVYAPESHAGAAEHLPKAIEPDLCSWEEYKSHMVTTKAPPTLPPIPISWKRTTRPSQEVFSITRKSMYASEPPSFSEFQDYHTYEILRESPAYPCHPMSAPSMQHISYPDQSPDDEKRHINQKYTVEQCDFIIYAWHDKKQKWANIMKDYAREFGSKPIRTIQGLQAVYYRMNNNIPVWDRDGWLVYDDEDAEDPSKVSIKCRQKDQGQKAVVELGLAHRYPERAVTYRWVDPETKHHCREWAMKRTFQIESRKERRLKKEKRRQGKL